jgi:hypothetical protein
MKSITLAFEGLSAKAAKMGLAIGTLCESFDDTHAKAWPIGPFVACSSRVLVSASQFA